MNEENPSLLKNDIAVRYTAELSLIEIGLGSFLHSFRIPFSGHLLALNQCFILNRAVIQSTKDAKSASPFLAAGISNTAAILKTLSPRGKKLTPMLGICAQGLLFNLGTFLFGTHLIGRTIASLLLSFWPLVQPLLIYRIILSDQFGSIIAFYTQLFSKVSWLRFKCTNCVRRGCYFQFAPLVSGKPLGNLFANCLDRKISAKVHRSTKTCAKCPQKITKAISERPLFPSVLITITLCAIFFYATLDSPLDAFFAFCRMLGIAYITFVILRNMPVDWFVKFLKKSRIVSRCAPHIEEVLKSIQKDS